MILVQALDHWNMKTDGDITIIMAKSTHRIMSSNVKIYVQQFHSID